MADSVARFTSRVENYVRYRPRYPRAVLETLVSQCGLMPQSRVADIGSGPGKLTELFLENGNSVYAVEPNAAMRQAAERLLSKYPGFHSVAGNAEATSLPDHSVDFVVAGQAFHWFDHLKARAEFQRVLKPSGWVALVWNAREREKTPFVSGYERLLQKYRGGNPRVDHQEIPQEVFAAFFGGSFKSGGFYVQTFPHFQDLDRAGLEGRVLSSSHTPEPGHPNYAPLLAELRKLFDTTQVNGLVRLEYTTAIYYGHLI
jgi:ubiquinone/menaquinone biosynthesis C-methylase UbiE